MRAVSLGLMLGVFWLALSGHYTAFLIAVGFACVVFTVWLAKRMGVIDEEGQPLQVYSRAPMYWLWLWREIFKSALAVSRVIWTPKLPISPTMTRVRARQSTSVGIATFANSITLTPGTITTDVSGRDLTVHSLVREGCDDVEAGAMNDRVSEFDGGA